MKHFVGAVLTLLQFPLLPPLPSLLSLSLSLSLYLSLLPRYIAVQNKPVARREGPGVLIVSEFAGSAQSLSGAIRVNPWNTEGGWKMVYL